jgi:hypothetical protein
MSELRCRELSVTVKTVLASTRLDPHVDVSWWRPAVALPGTERSDVSNPPRLDRTWPRRSPSK